jgi:hypothetical protein
MSGAQGIAFVATVVQQIDFGEGGLSVPSQAVRTRLAAGP